MEETSNFSSSASFVFASGTTAAQAMQFHRAVAEFAPSVTLRARPDEEWHYGDKFGFEYIELDSAEPVQAALKEVSDARNERIKSEAQTSRQFNFTEPLSFVLIVLTAIGAGAASEVGKDLWSGVKGGVRWLWSRVRQGREPPSAFARLFEDLGRYHDRKSTWNPVVLFRVARVRLTFVVEPGMPKEAIKQAERLINRPKRNMVDVPLRWNRDRSKWLPLPGAFRSEDTWRELRGDISMRGRSELRD